MKQAHVEWGIILKPQQPIVMVKSMEFKAFMWQIIVSFQPLLQQVLYFPIAP